MAPGRGRRCAGAEAATVTEGHLVTTTGSGVALRTGTVITIMDTGYLIDILPLGFSDTARQIMRVLLLKVFFLGMLWHDMVLGVLFSVWSIQLCAAECNNRMVHLEEYH